MSTVMIAGRVIWIGQPCYVIAEAGVNHNGSVSRALEMINVAKSAGADAVKFQVLYADKYISRHAPQADYMMRTVGGDESQRDLIARLNLSDGDFATIKQYCDEMGITFLATAFEETAADFLDGLGVPAFKIPSGEIDNLRFLQHVARKGRPMIVSTGMATLAEVDEALRAIRGAGDPPVVLMQCTSNYPADTRDANLRAIETMRAAFGVPVGLSDHTSGDICALVAVGLGMAIYERHFTLNRELPGPDHKASAEPDELRRIIANIREAEAALGTGRKEMAASERNTRDVARKSIVAAMDIPAGAMLGERHLALKRPGTGLRPSAMQYIVGRTAKRAIQADDPITLEMLEP